MISFPSSFLKIFMVEIFLIKIQKAKEKLILLPYHTATIRYYHRDSFALPYCSWIIYAGEVPYLLAPILILIKALGFQAESFVSEVLPSSKV